MDTELCASLRAVLQEWLANVDEALEDEPGSWDAAVRIGARWEKGNYSHRIKEILDV